MEQRVREFMEKCGQDCPSKITVPSDEVRLLRAKLIMEEALEACEAMGVKVPAFELSEKPIDLPHVANELADVSVVTIGSMIAFGFPVEKILKIVDEANLRKFGPGSYRRADGKWIKPPGFVGPMDELRVLIRTNNAVGNMGSL